MNKFVKNLISVSLMFSFVVLGFSGPKISSAAGPAAVDLLSAGNFVILAKTAITTTGATDVTGDIGVSPNAASSMTGFGLVMDSSNTFSTSSLVTGNVYASNYAVPTPANMTTAISNMQAAYTDAAGRTIPTATELGAGNIGGMNLVPGLYKWSTDVTIPTDLTLTGLAGDVWIFQIAGNLSIDSAQEVILAGDALPENVFWQVGGGTGATLGTMSIFNGNILSAKQIIIQTGATLNGRALAQTQVTLDAAIVAVPAGSIPAEANLTVNKVVINDDNRTNVISDFPLFVNGMSVTSGDMNVFPSFVTYRVTETTDSHYTRTFSDDCDNSGYVTLSPGDNKTCTITNDDKRSSTSSGSTPMPILIAAVQEETPIVDVVVTPVVPSLPVTGFPPRGESNGLFLIISFGIVGIIFSIYSIKNKKII